jgi:hypothetical protein
MINVVNSNNARAAATKRMWSVRFAYYSLHTPYDKNFTRSEYITDAEADLGKGFRRSADPKLIFIDQIGLLKLFIFFKCID